MVSFCQGCLDKVSLLEGLNIRSLFIVSQLWRLEVKA
jgi:hypothetical protein